MQAACVQLLIEICGMEFEKENENFCENLLLSSKREVQCVACSAIHQIFVNDDKCNVARLVTMQVLVK